MRKFSAVNIDGEKRKITQALFSQWIIRNLEVDLTLCSYDKCSIYCIGLRLKSRLFLTVELLAERSAKSLQNFSALVAQCRLLIVD